ncbi:MAG: DNA-3-methyladenine glycosylase [Firmicutes bacterium]|nr:DNA-3-methyladenine glycosylase [Bacillota bacterium]
MKLEGIRSSETTAVVWPNGPFAWPEVLRYLSRSDDEPLWRVTRGRVTRLVSVVEMRVWVDIAWVDGALEIEMRSVDRPISQATRLAVVDHVAQWLDLTRDLSPFYQQMRDCPILSPLVQRYAGLRLVGIVDLFEALCWAVIGQQINLPFAYSIKRQLVHALGERCQVAGEEYWLFPTAQTVASAGVSVLRELRLTQRKAEYICEVARQIADGSLSKGELAGLPESGSAAARLMSIRGIGPWTAAYVAMRCLRDLTAFPVQDVGVQQAVQNALQLERKPVPDKLRELGVRWAGWEAYATFYL